MKIPKVGQIVMGLWEDSGLLSESSGIEPWEQDLLIAEIFGRVLCVDSEGVVIGMMTSVPVADPANDVTLKVSHSSVKWTLLKEA